MEVPRGERLFIQRHRPCVAQQYTDVGSRHRGCHKPLLQISEGVAIKADHQLGGQLFIDDQRADRRYVGFLDGLLKTGTLSYHAA